jgi:tripartite-type tricarboxylate transporter receptor subunit TctC
VAKALANPEVRERFAEFGFEPWIAAPLEISKTMESDTGHFAEIVKGARISLD